MNTRVCEERFRTRYTVKELKDLEGRLAALAGTWEATRSWGKEGLTVAQWLPLVDI